MLTLSAVARPFCASDVPAESKWVAYADTAKIRSSQVGRFMLASMDANDRAKLDGFHAIFKFDLIQDIDSVLLFGPNLKKNGEGVLIISGHFDKTHLVTMLKANDTYASVLHDDTVIHNWVDDKYREKSPDKRTYGAFAPNGDIVMGDSQSLVKKALDVLSGRSAGLSMDSALNLSDRSDAVLVAAALEVQDGARLPSKAAMLRQTRNMYFAMREADGELHTELEINADSAEAAFYMDSVVRGMLSMVFLHDDVRPGLSELARGVQVHTVDEQVMISSINPVEQVTRMLEKAGRQKFK
jgi:hypothetical protein